VKAEGRGFMQVIGQQRVGYYSCWQRYAQMKCQRSRLLGSFSAPNYSSFGHLLTIRDANRFVLWISMRSHIRLKS